MVEEIKGRNGRPTERTPDIINLTHYPKEGGLRVLAVSKAEDGGYMLRLGYYNRDKNVREQQIMRLSEQEMAYVVLRLLGEIVRGG